MLAGQDHACALCRKAPRDRLCVDHCHDALMLRSLLCRTCNRGLGNFDDDPGLLRAAESGHTWAQLQLAEHYSQTNGSPGDPVAAYMWCLLSEKTAASMRNRIESGKDVAEVNSIEHVERRYAELQTLRLLPGHQERLVDTHVGGEVSRPPENVPCSIFARERRNY